MMRFLIKGLLRDRSRSLFPVLTVSAGVFLTVFFYNFMQGVFADFVSSNARFDTGHVKVMTRAYAELADQFPNDLAILECGRLIDELRGMKSDMLWVPRIRFGGLLDVPDEKGETRSQAPVLGIGANILEEGSQEKKILNLEGALVEGTLPRSADEILISRDFAERLGVKTGDTATLIGSTMYGSMAMYNFRISGMLRFGMVALDRSTIVADIEGVREALDMRDAAGEILGYTRDMVYSDEKMTELAEEFGRRFSGSDDEFSPVMLPLGRQRGLGEYLSLVKSMGSIIVAVFMVAMSIVLWNSGLLNSLRRYGEIGVRLAMGEPKGALYRRTIAESVIIGIIGSAAGTLAGIAISLYLKYVGLDYSGVMQNSTVLIPNEIRTDVNFTSFYIGFIPGLIASVLGTAFSGIGIYRRQTANLFKELEV
ncbi:MAG: FtsX-like permease family protein [Elusimicrobia bacterium]|nr:FtsX-like permease family protein [Elusimicrobiota bacterium]